MLKAFRYTFDTRDQGLNERIGELDNRHGLWRCHKITNCFTACPKNLNPTEAISKLQRKIVSEKL